VQRPASQRVVEAEIEHTFPLDLVEVVFGDGRTTGRQIVSGSDVEPAGRHRFLVPFAATGQKWLRFAAWDVAGNGALTQPARIAQ
jgi:hypothetical protein